MLRETGKEDVNSVHVGVFLYEPWYVSLHLQLNHLISIPTRVVSQFYWLIYYLKLFYWGSRGIESTFTLRLMNIHIHVIKYTDTIMHMYTYS